MTLNGVTALILLYFTEFDSFTGLLHHSDWREAYTVCKISSSTFGQNWPILQRDLSAIAELLVLIIDNTRYFITTVFSVLAVRLLLY